MTGLTDLAALPQVEGVKESQSQDQAGKAEWEAAVTKQTEAAMAALVRSAKANFYLRLVLAAIGLFSLGAAVYYVVSRADSQVIALLGQEDVGFDEDRLLALVVPVALLTLLAFISLGVASLIQRRSGEDFAAGQENVSRLRREVEAGVSRSRSLSHTLEEFVDNSRRAFRLQLWISQALFIVFVVLLLAAVIQALAQGADLLTAVFGAGSAAALFIERMTNSPKDVALRLADSAQTQLAVVNTTREFSVVEEFLYKALEVNKRDPGQSGPVLAAGLAQMEAITQNAMVLIQTFVEGDGVVDDSPDDAPGSTTGEIASESNLGGNASRPSPPVDPVLS